jgi:hypothetical protein
MKHLKYLIPFLLISAPVQADEYFEKLGHYQSCVVAACEANNYGGSSLEQASKVADEWCSFEKGEFLSLLPDELRPGMEAKLDRMRMVYLKDQQRKQSKQSKGDTNV